MSVQDKVKRWLEEHRDTKLIAALNRAKSAQARLSLARRVRHENLNKPMR